MADSPSRIVICDDDGTTRYLLKMLLADQGFDVVGEASNGASGLEKCRQLRPDVLFLDIIMPDMDGLGVLQRINQEKIDVGVVMISGHPTATNLKTALENGASGFIIKPFNPEKVIREIDNATRKSRAGRIDGCNPAGDAR